MKKIKHVFVTGIFCIAVYQPLAWSQGTWTQKANVFTSPRAGVAGFSIGTKGYMGTGWLFGFNPAFFVDFWEWDQTTSAWTQKANFAGSARGDAMSFSIGNKGYIVTGTTIGFALASNELWEWDQATNTWSQKALFPGVQRSTGAAFSIGAFGYAGFGFGGGNGLSDLWQYSQASNTWTQMTSIPVGRFSCTVFATGGFGYVCGGIMSGVSYLDDVWEFNPATNSWTQKADFGGGVRAYAAGFSIGNKGYMGTGSDVSNSFADFWCFDPALNSWSQKANYPHAVSDIDQSGFSVGCFGYFGTGATGSSGNPNYFNDFWEYDPDTCSLTGIENMASVNPAILISPNPFSDKISVTINSTQPAEIFIYDTNLKKVAQAKFMNAVSINTKSFAKGVYVYEVRTKNGILQSGKMVKNK